MTKPGTITESYDGNVMVISFGADLKQIDELNVTQIGDQLMQVAEGLPVPKLVLDMSVTEFFGSSFIEVLFRVWKNLSKKHGAQLAIAGLQPYCREVLKVTRLDSLRQVYETTSAAAQALNSGSTAI